MTENSTSKKSKFISAASNTIGFLRHSEKRSNGAFAAVAIVAFLVPWGASKALDAVWTAYNPDETERHLGEISTNAEEIKLSVASVSDALKNVQATIPEEQYSSIMGMLQAIDTKATNIEPIATRLASASQQYANGARMSEGPYVGTGSFYFDTNVNSPNLTKQICGGSTVSYDPAAASYSRVSLNVGGRTNTGGANGRAVSLRDVAVTVSPDSQSPSLLQVFYECDTST